MVRRSFIDVIRSSGTDIAFEYEMLIKLLYEPSQGISDDDMSLYRIIDDAFNEMPIRGTCSDLHDFDRAHGFEFDSVPTSDDLDMLLLLAEYIFNLSNEASRTRTWRLWCSSDALLYIAKHIAALCEKIGYHAIEHDNMYLLVEDDPAAIEASLSLPEDICSLPFQYRHHSLEGNIAEKRGILLQLANEIEPKRALLKEYSSRLEDDLFFCLNNLNIRHNNADKQGKYYNAHIESMDSEELEKWYDYVFHMEIMALLALNDMPAPNQLKELRERIKPRS